MIWNANAAFLRFRLWYQHQSIHTGLWNLVQICKLSRTLLVLDLFWNWLGSKAYMCKAHSHWAKAKVKMFFDICNIFYDLFHLFFDLFRFRLPFRWVWTDPNSGIDTVEISFDAINMMGVKAVSNVIQYNFYTTCFLCRKCPLRTKVDYHKIYWSTEIKSL